jgi:pectinesterase inhibitor-like protein
MATWVEAHDDDDDDDEDVAVISPLLGGVGSVPTAAVAGGLFKELARLFGSLVVRVALLVLFVLAILSNYAGPNDQLLLLRVMREKLTMMGDQDMNIDAACRVTLHPETCNETLRSSGLHGPSCSKVVDARELTLLSVSSAAQGVQNTMASVHALATTARRVQQQLQLPIVAVGALEVCDHTLSLSIQQLGAARADLQLLLEAEAWKKVGTTSQLDDVKTRVTAAMEFHTTCIATLMESGVLSMMPGDQSHETSAIFQVKDRTDQLLSNAIAFINAFSTYGNHLPSWSSPVLSDISRLFLHPTTSLFSYPSPGTQCSHTAQQDLTSSCNEILTCCHSPCRFSTYPSCCIVGSVVVLRR